MRPAAELPPDLAERFEFLAILGHGAFGRVLRARDRRLGREVAIKLLVAAFDDPDATARFRREAKATASLQHPSIVEIFDHGVSADGQRFLVFELVEGDVLCERRGGASCEDLRRWGAGLAAALAAAHEAGILHRDVKPSNVVIDPSGRARLLDFGLARSSRAGTMLTATGALVGTPLYMAPEVIQGAPVTAAADQFALAATLLEVATGAPPFPVERVQVLLASGPPTEPPEAPRLAAEDPDLHAALRRGMSPDPAARWPDCEAFSRALARPRARRSSISQDRPEPRRARLPLLPVALVLASSLGGAALWRMATTPTASGPIPVVTRGPAEPPSISRAEFDDLLDRLDEIHKAPGDGQHGLVEDHAEELLDPRLALTVRRLRLSLPPFLATAGGRQLLEKLDHRLTHLRHDLEQLAGVALGLQGDVLGNTALIVRSAEVQDRREEFLDELAALSLQLEPYLEAGDPGRSLHVVRLWALAMDRRDPSRCGEAALALARLIPTCPTAPLLVQTQIDLDLLVHPSGGMVCPDRVEARRVIQAMVESGGEIPPTISPDHRAEVMVSALSHALRNATKRSEPPVEADLALILHCLNEVWARAPGLTSSARQQFARRIELLAASRVRHVQAHHPGLQAVLAEVLEVVRGMYRGEGLDEAQRPVTSG